jgi:hypothetical protein
MPPPNEEGPVVLVWRRGLRGKKDEAATYSSAYGSTIGAGELNGRVRDGNGWGLPAVATSSKSWRSMAWGISAGVRSRVAQCEVGRVSRTGARVVNKQV